MRKKLNVVTFHGTVVEYPRPEGSDKPELWLVNFDE